MIIADIILKIVCQMAGAPLKGVVAGWRDEDSVRGRALALRFMTEFNVPERVINHRLRWEDAHARPEAIFDNARLSELDASYRALYASIKEVLDADCGSLLSGEFHPVPTVATIGNEWFIVNLGAVYDKVCLLVTDHQGRIITDIARRLADEVRVFTRDMASGETYTVQVSAGEDVLFQSTICQR